MVDFLKYRYFFLVLSIAVLGVGIFGYVKNNGFAYHIDFEGGSELRLKFEKVVDIAKVRSAVEHSGWSHATIQTLGSTSDEFLVRIKSDEEGANIGERFKRKVSDKLSDHTFVVSSVDHVGPEAGKEVCWNAAKSIILALIALLIYIAARFRFAYGLGAIVSLGHDLLAILSFLLITKMAFSQHVLAAIIALLGYSLNDTIIIFSKIRECAAKTPPASTQAAYDLVNYSLNKTLRRTLLTSFATFLSVTVLYLFGGEALEAFSLTMMIAIVVGTYSSIYIASPVMLAVAGTKL